MRIFYFLLLSLFLTPAFSADYYWATSPVSTGLHASAIDACIATSNLNLGGNIQNGYAELQYVSSVRFQCKFKKTDGSPWTSSQTYLTTRNGDSCPSGTTYNAQTGACDEPQPSPCEWAANDFFDHMHKYGDLGVNGSVTNLTPPPDSICHNSCVFSNPTALNTRECFRFVSGDPAGAFCMFNYRGTDQECTAGDTPATAKPPTEPTSSDSSDCTNKVTDAEGRVSYVCTSTTNYEDPGSMNCGEVDGAVTCYPKTPSPTSTTTTVEQDITETPNPDGSTTTETTTTTNKTNCIGVGSCSTTTSVSNNTSKTNADGSPGGETSTCTGTGCKDSEGNTQDDRKEEEESKPSVSGESCGVPVVCSGDVIQCAILKQQKEESCLTKEAGDFESKKADTEALVQGEQFQTGEKDIQVSSFITGSTRFLPASCPAAESFNLSVGSYEISYQPICSLAEAMGPLIVAVSAFLAALYVGRSFGG